MFKAGDKALTNKGNRIVEIRRTLQADNSPGWGQVETEDGVYWERELHQAHQTVLDTIEAKEQDFIGEMSEAMAEVFDEVPWKLTGKLNKLLNEANLKVDFRGHWKNGSALYDSAHFTKKMMRHQLFLGVERKNIEDLIEVLVHNKKKQALKKLDRWIGLGQSVGLGSSACTYCAKDNFQLETDGITVRLLGDTCPVPEGFEPNVWELNVPSGKLVIENGLSNWFPLPEGDLDCDINTIIGCREYSQLHAAIGLSFGFVGNTCPSVVEGEKKDSYRIANGSSEKELANICTDLWWYSICDYEELERRLEKFGDHGDRGMSQFTVIDVKPGVYQFNHYDEADCHATEVLFADFAWVREPGPVKDFLGECSELPEVNPHAYVQRQCQQWPTLYGKTGSYPYDEVPVPWEQMSEEDQHHSWERVANQIFFTLGGGTSWHENGFPAEKVAKDVVDIEPPSFRYQVNWYPFSKGYGGLFGDVKLSNSFARLAFRCLESIISFGMKVSDSERCRHTYQARSRMSMAVTKYREMAQLYPEAADPEYVWWLSEKGRAEAWVERFDLGPKYTEKHRKYVQAQRWVPDDAYAIEFDTRKISDGQFTGKNGCWSSKASADGFAILEWGDFEPGENPEDNCFWASHAERTAVPLYSVARVVKVGEVSHMGRTLVELSYDYGTEWMRSATTRKAVEEKVHKQGIRVLSKEEYNELLPTARNFSS